MAEGTLHPGDAVRVLPSGVQTHIKAVLLGFDVLVSFISPFRAERRMARSLFAPGEDAEVNLRADRMPLEQWVETLHVSIV